MTDAAALPGALRGAARDVVDGTRDWQSWLTLAWYDIVLRYRRSMLGPLWITVSMGLMLLGIGPLYSMVFDVPLRQFLPHVTLGIVFWQFIAATLNDGCNAVTGGGRALKQSPIPVTALTWRVISRHVIQLAHHLVLFVPVAAWWNAWPGIHGFAAIPGLMLVSLTLHAGCTALGILCARFRDGNQIVASLLQLAMFLTPVFWVPEGDVARSRLVTWNPLVPLLEVMRRPLLGEAVDARTWMVAGGTCAAAVVAAIILLAYSRRRLVYWL